MVGYHPKTEHLNDKHDGMETHNHSFTAEIWDWRKDERFDWEGRRSKGSKDLKVGKWDFWELGKLPEAEKWLDEAERKEAVSRSRITNRVKERKAILP